ncbi:MAG: DUF4142 domain-containing protein [Bdellovibrionia bacterium]
MKTFDQKRFVAWTLATLLASTPLFAQDKAGQSDDPSKMSMEQFQKNAALGHIHHINQKEIQLSKMAQDKSQSKQVKDFAQHMITDHQNADRRVMEMAEAQNVKLPDLQLAGYEKATSEQLDKMKGTQFDQAFFMQMDLEHKMAAQELEAIRSSVKDPQIAALIDGILPTVREHQKSAARFEKSQGQMAGQIHPESKTHTNDK